MDQVYSNLAGRESNVHKLDSGIYVVEHAGPGLITRIRNFLDSNTGKVVTGLAGVIAGLVAVSTANADGLTGDMKVLTQGQEGPQYQLTTNLNAQNFSEDFKIKYAFERNTEYDNNALQIGSDTALIDLMFKGDGSSRSLMRFNGQNYWLSGGIEDGDGIIVLAMVGLDLDSLRDIQVSFKGEDQISGVYMDDDGHDMWTIGLKLSKNRNEINTSYGNSAFGTNYFAWARVGNNDYLDLRLKVGDKQKYDLGRYAFSVDGKGNNTLSNVEDLSIFLDLAEIALTGAENTVGDDAGDIGLDTRYKNLQTFYTDIALNTGDIMIVKDIIPFLGYRHNYKTGDDGVKLGLKLNIGNKVELRYQDLISDGTPIHQVMIVLTK